MSEPREIHVIKKTTATRPTQNSSKIGLAFSLVALILIAFASPVKAETSSTCEVLTFAPGSGCYGWGGWPASSVYATVPGCSSSCYHVDASPWCLSGYNCDTPDPNPPRGMYLGSLKYCGNFLESCIWDNYWWPGSQYYGHTLTMYHYYYEPQTFCNLAITNFSGNKTIIDPYAGENVTFTGNMTETTTWVMVITDSEATWRTVSGIGTSVSATWNGTDSSGRVVNDGTYTATLSATTDGQCVKRATAQVTVKSTVIKLEYVSGSGQEAYICETLQNPFLVAVDGPPQSGNPVNWQITVSPDGSNPSIGQSTNNGSLSSAYLKLGSLPGTYTTQATCAKCTQGSPQVFSAVAKCPEVPEYYQTDYPDTPYDDWCKYTDTVKKSSTSTNMPCMRDAKGNLLSGYSAYTIAEKGCALTSLSMVADRYGSTADPAVWNSFLNQVDGFLNGNIRWDVLPGIDMQIDLTSAISGDTVLSNSLMDDYISSCMPVIVKVKNWKQKSDGTWKWSWHWVVVVDKSNNYTIIDPGPKAGANLAAYGNEIYAITAYKKSNGGCQ
jgi:hypothetical protein